MNPAQIYGFISAAFFARYDVAGNKPRRAAGPWAPDSRLLSTDSWRLSFVPKSLYFIGNAGQKTNYQ